MAVICPGCGAQYDHTLFAFGRTIICECGAEVGTRFPSRGRLAPDGRDSPEAEASDRAAEAEESDRVARAIARAADRVCRMILNPEAAEIDIELEIALAREIVFQAMPERLELFELVYGARFARLRDQFRS